MEKTTKTTKITSETKLGDLKELIVTKKQSYQDIADAAKKANVNKTFVTGVSLAAAVVGIAGVITPIGAFGFAASLVAGGLGTYGSIMNVPKYAKNLFIRCKSKLAQRKYNKWIKEIDSLTESKEKTKKEDKKKTKKKTK